MLPAVKASAPAPTLKNPKVRPVLGESPQCGCVKDALKRLVLGSTALPAVITCQESKARDLPGRRRKSKLPRHPRTCPSPELSHRETYPPVAAFAVTPQVLQIKLRIWELNLVSDQVRGRKWREPCPPIYSSSDLLTRQSQNAA